MSRPKHSNLWTHLTPMDLYITDKDELIFTKTNNNGYPKFTRTKQKHKKCTIMLGTKIAIPDDGNKKIKILPNDKVWTCNINEKGNPNSLGIEYPDTDITIIIHN